jgi:hypothetical protein
LCGNCGLHREMANNNNTITPELFEQYLSFFLQDNPHERKLTH